jgi:hypothetical protein
MVVQHAVGLLPLVGCPRRFPFPRLSCPGLNLVLVEPCCNPSRRLLLVSFLLGEGTSSSGTSTSTTAYQPCQGVAPLLFPFQRASSNDIDDWESGLTEKSGCWRASPTCRQQKRRTPPTNRCVVCSFGSLEPPRLRPSRQLPRPAVHCRNF